MLCLVHYLFVISTSVIHCLGRFVPEITYYVSSETLNLTKRKLISSSFNSCVSCLICSLLTKFTVQTYHPTLTVSRRLCLTDKLISQVVSL